MRFLLSFPLLFGLVLVYFYLSTPIEKIEAGGGYTLSYEAALNQAMRMNPDSFPRKITGGRTTYTNITSNFPFKLFLRYFGNGITDEGYDVTQESQVTSMYRFVQNQGGMAWDYFVSGKERPFTHVVYNKWSCTPGPIINVSYSSTGRVEFVVSNSTNLTLTVTLRELGNVNPDWVQLIPPNFVDDVTPLTTYHRQGVVMVKTPGGDTCAAVMYDQDYLPFGSEPVPTKTATVGLSPTATSTWPNTVTPVAYGSPRVSATASATRTSTPTPTPSSTPTSTRTATPILAYSGPQNGSEKMFVPVAQK